MTRAKLVRYDSVLSIHALSAKLADKQYCYVDSERALNSVIARLYDYGTVRATQLAHNSFILAWSKAKPKRRAGRVLYTDIGGKEHNQY